MYEPIDMTDYCIECFSEAQNMDEESVRELFVRTGLFDVIKECFIIFSHAGPEKTLELCRTYFEVRNIPY